MTHLLHAAAMAASVLAATVAWVPARAAVAPGTSGNGELFLNIFDATARVSYTFDIGIRMDEFFTIAQQNAGYQRFWVIDSPRLEAFLGLSTAPNRLWSVVALDSVGPSSIGGQRLFTTVRQGDEGRITQTTNQAFVNGIGSSQGGTFFDVLNGVDLANAGQSTHTPAGPAAAPDFSINGDSYSLEADGGNAYYGESGGLTSNLNGNARFNAANAIGQSSWFYYVTRSGPVPGNFVIYDEFDNGNPADGGFDGYWGFTQVTDPRDNDLPYFGKYLLSFSMPVFDIRTSAASRSFAAAIGRTELSGGFWSTAVEAATGAALEQAAAIDSTALGAAGGMAVPMPALLSPVPEPAPAWLLLAGVAALAVRLRR